jgi:chromosome segregation ATPase
MKRLSLLPLVLLLISTTAFGQTNSTDSDTLKSLLSEVRQLRRDLQTTTVAAQRAQILIYRTQAQESVVRRMQERVDDTRSKLAQIQYEEKSLTAAAKQNQDLLDHTDNPTTRKELEQGIAQFKAHQEIQANTEQETRAKLSELEEELRLEQAKLDELQDQLNRLEKTLENSNASR